MYFKEKKCKSMATVEEIILKQVIFFSHIDCGSLCVLFTGPLAPRNRVIPSLHNCLISFTHRYLKAKPLLEVLDVVVTYANRKTVGICRDIILRDVPQASLPVYP